MVIEFPCWNCGKNLKSAVIHAGKKCKCKGCESVNSIPGVAQPSTSNTAVEDEFEDEEEAHEADEAESEPPVRKKVPPRPNDHGKIFCYKCGASIFEEAEICPHCGVRQKRATSTSANGSGGVTSRVTAFLFAFFLGLFGAHKFYLGQTGMGIVYLVIGTIGWGLFFFTFGVPQIILAVICLIEAITYLSMTDEQFTAKYGR